jgi:hypothetical protein
MASEILITLLCINLFLWPAWSTVLLAILGYAVCTPIHNRYGNGLIQYPGPFFASLSNWWRLRDTYVNGNKRPTYVQLHKKYGDVVRIAPKVLSFASPGAIADIYDPKNNMAKVGMFFLAILMIGSLPRSQSRWYVAFEAHGKGPRKENIFSTPDIHWHARYQAAVQPGFSMKHLAPREAQIDELITNLFQNLEEAASKSQNGAPIDLPLNLQYFTFDVGGVFAFSRPYGFLKQKSDIDGIIESAHVGSVHLSRVSEEVTGHHREDVGANEQRSLLRCRSCRYSLTRIQWQSTSGL